MSAVLTPAVWQPDDYIFFRKCGEITISPDIQYIGFNCLFCTGICLQSDIFLQHLQDQHKADIFKLYEQQNPTLIDGEFVNFNKQEVNLGDIAMQQNLKLNTSNKNNENILDIEGEQNCVMLNMFTPTQVVSLTSATTDLNLLYDLENNDLLTLSSNQELENLITINPLQSRTNTSSTFTLPSLTTVATSDCIKCAPDDSACEIGDGEDSGIMLVQSPCTSVSGGFSDCMSFTEDSSSKSTNTFDDNWKSPIAEFKKQPKESDLMKNDECDKKPKGKYIKSPAISKALSNKDLISYLLKAYRKNEKLWNPEHPSYKYNARRTIYNELSKPLLQDMNYSLTGNEIFAIINALRGRYRRELTKFQARKGKHKTHLWYFEQMEFLRKIIEDKRKERTKDNEISDTDALYKNITDRQVLSYLLQLYKNFECLWNPNVTEYESCNKSQVYEEIALQMQDKFNISITVKDCLNEIQKLRIRYRKELRILHKLKGLYITKLWCFDEMEFLRPLMEEKVTKKLKKKSCHIARHFTQGKYDFLKAEEIKFADLEQQLQFIEIYRNYTSLWDVDHPDYRSTNYRNKALNEMLEAVNLTFTQNKIELQQLEKTIYQMRRDFSTEKQKRLIMNDSITNSDNTAFSLLLYEKLSGFLTINLGPFRCADCQQICKTYDQYKIHLSKHDGNLPFICTLCGKGFQMPGNLTIHIRRHRRDFPYSCEICKKSFATSTEVSIHMRSHTGERPYICDFCGKTFKTWSFFDIHKRTHLKQSNFHCPICDKSFYERNRFTDHMNVHLNIRKHQCEQCGKGFTTYGNLKKHLELHAPVKKYKCQPCGKSFAQFASLRWHRKTQHEQ